LPLLAVGVPIGESDSVLGVCVRSTLVRLRELCGELRVLAVVVADPLVDGLQLGPAVAARVDAGEDAASLGLEKLEVWGVARVRLRDGVGCLRGGGGRLLGLAGSVLGSVGGDARNERRLVGARAPWLAQRWWVSASCGLLGFERALGDADGAADADGRDLAAGDGPVHGVGREVEPPRGDRDSDRSLGSYWFRLLHCPVVRLEPRRLRGAHDESAEWRCCPPCGGSSTSRMSRRCSSPPSPGAAQLVGYDRSSGRICFAELFRLAWELSERYDAGQGRFASFVYSAAQRRTVDFVRRERGRTRWTFGDHTYQRTLPTMVTLDDRLDEADTRSGVDPARDSDPDLERLLATGDSQRPELADLGSSRSTRAAA
jgi:hypothetical protein